MQQRPTKMGLQVQVVEMVLAISTVGTKITMGINGGKGADGVLARASLRPFIVHAGAFRSAQLQSH
jgi:hypothetical protein